MIKTTAVVHGMMCSMCEKHVIKAVEENFDVKSVSASHEQQILEIISDGPIDEGRLDEVISAQGYILEKTEKPKELTGEELMQVTGGATSDSDIRPTTTQGWFSVAEGDNES